MAGLNALNFGVGFESMMFLERRNLQIRRLPLNIVNNLNNW
jgi:hypothetical protein